jgi:hypothetical protein
MPQIVSGIYTPEEVSDFSAGGNALPAPQEAPRQQGRRAPVETVYVESNPNPVADPKKAVNDRLDELLGKYEPLASQYLIEKGYIKDTQSYIDLDAMTAQKILSNPTKIIGILESLTNEQK